ncbi:nuclear transport factor 2 family protein [Nocardia gipuzkoensis]
MAVVDRHIAAMGTRDIDTIAADYSEDAVIITTLAPEPLVGKVAMKAFLATLMAAGAEELDTAAAPTFTRKEAVGSTTPMTIDNVVSRPTPRRTWSRRVPDLPPPRRRR